MPGSTIFPARERGRISIQHRNPSASVDRRLTSCTAEDIIGNSGALSRQPVMQNNAKIRGYKIEAYTTLSKKFYYSIDQPLYFQWRSGNSNIWADIKREMSHHPCIDRNTRSKPSRQSSCFFSLSRSCSSSRAAVISRSLCRRAACRLPFAASILHLFCSSFLRLAFASADLPIPLSPANVRDQNLIFHPVPAQDEPEGDALVSELG